VLNYQEQDPKLWQAISQEQDRQQHNIELIASENIVSPQFVQPKVPY
jgi:Glycine/serine hydroxymethyltransferase